MADNDKTQTEASSTADDANQTPETGSSAQGSQSEGAPKAATDAESGADEVSRLQALADEYRDQMLRLRAESENQRKRLERENSNAVKYAAEKVFRDLLAVADSLELGLKAARDSDTGGAVVEGLEMTHKQLNDTLSRHGVKIIDPAEAPFDPELHEAVSMVPSGAVAPNHVLEVVQKGYQLHERVLRAARVVVASAPPQDNAASDGESATQKPGSGH